MWTYIRTIWCRYPWTRSLGSKTPSSPRWYFSRCTRMTLDARIRTRWRSRDDRRSRRAISSPDRLYRAYASRSKDHPRRRDISPKHRAHVEHLESHFFAQEIWAIRIREITRRALCFSERSRRVCLSEGRYIGYRMPTEKARKTVLTKRIFFIPCAYSVERWQSGWMQQSWKLPCRKVPRVRIPVSPPDCDYFPYDYECMSTPLFVVHVLHNLEVRWVTQVAEEAGLLNL